MKDDDEVLLARVREVLGGQLGNWRNISLDELCKNPKVKEMIESIAFEVTAFQDDSPTGNAALVGLGILLLTVFEEKLVHVESELASIRFQDQLTI